MMSSAASELHDQRADRSDGGAREHVEPVPEEVVSLTPISCFGDTDFVFRTTPVSCFGDTGFVFR